MFTTISSMFATLALSSCCEKSSNCKRHLCIIRLGGVRTDCDERSMFVSTGCGFCCLCALVSCRINGPGKDASNGTNKSNERCGSCSEFIG